MTFQMVDIHTPGLKWWLSHLESEFHPTHSVELYVNALKRRSVRNNTPVALGTAQLFLRLISNHKFTGIHQLVDYVVLLEEQLCAARPKELAIRNMVRRVLGIVREEAENAGLGDQVKAALEAVGAAEKDGLKAPPKQHGGRLPLLTSHTSFASSSAQITSLFNVLSHPTTPPAGSAASTPPQTGYHTPNNVNPLLLHQKDIRPAIIQDIQDLIEELESMESNISDYGPQLIHKNEVVMTYGLSLTVHNLLLRAAQKRNHDFTVIVVEGSANILDHTHQAVMNKIPLTEEEESFKGTNAKKSLQERGIQVIVISDSNIVNFMGRVNKVLFAADYVLADGAVITSAGITNMVNAANYLQKPVVVVAGSHVLSPVTCFNPMDMIEMGPPATVGYEDDKFLERIDFPNPLVDYIEPKRVTMFVTNNGIIARTAVTRATLELYHMPEADLM